jgi:hypothetical protein
MNNASRYRPKVTKQDPLRSFGQNFLESQDWFINLLSGKLFLGNPLIGQKSKIAYSFGFRYWHTNMIGFVFLSKREQIDRTSANHS